MAKLYFYYSTMNAGKTTNLLQSAYNYRERGMRAYRNGDLYPLQQIIGPIGPRNRRSATPSRKYRGWSSGSRRT